MGAVTLRPRPGAELTTAALAGAATVGLLAGLASTRPLVAIALAGAIPFLLLTSLRTKVMVYFVVLPLIGWVKYQLPDTEVQGAPDLVALAILVHLGWELVTGKTRFPILHPFVLLVLLYALAPVVQSQAPLVAARGVGIPGARIYLEPLILFLAGTVVLRQPGTARLFLRVGLVTGAVVGLYMLKQLLFGFSPAEFAFQAGRQNARIVAEQRLFSTLSGPAVFGFVSAAFTVLGVVARAMRVWPRTAVAVAVLSAFGVVASGTRIALIALVPALAVLVVLLLKDRSTKRLAHMALGVGLCGAMAIGALLIITPVPSTREATYESPNAIAASIEKLALLKRGSADEDWAARVDRAGRFIAFIGERPWGSGSGFTLLVDEQGEPQAGVFRIRTDLPRYTEGEFWIFQRDFYYFALGVELGLLPLLMFLGILLGGLVLSIVGWSRAQDRTPKLMMTLTASVLAITLVQNLSNESFRAPQVAGYVWFLLAVPVALSRGSVERARSAQAGDVGPEAEPPDGSEAEPAEEAGERSPAVSRRR